MSLLARAVLLAAGAVTGFLLAWVAVEQAESRLRR